MNDRIKKLMEQASGGACYDQETNTLFGIEIDRFAELIVRECAAFMYENYPDTRYEINLMRKHMGDKDWNKPIGVDQ